MGLILEARSSSFSFFKRSVAYGKAVLGKSGNEVMLFTRVSDFSNTEALSKRPDLIMISNELIV